MLNGTTVVSVTCKIGIKAFKSHQIKLHLHILDEVDLYAWIDPHVLARLLRVRPCGRAWQLAV